MALCKLRMFLLLAFISPGLMMATDEAMEIDSEEHELSVFFAGLAINDSEQLACNVLDFHNWTETQLMILLNDKTYRDIESTLIINLETALLQQASSGITTPHELMSFYLAHHAINLSFCHDNTITLPQFKDPYQSLIEACEAAREVGFDAWKSISQQLEEKLPFAIQKLTSQGGQTLPRLKLRLANIFRLAYSAQPSFVETFLQKAHLDALQQCGFNGFLLPKDQALAMIGEGSWLKTEIANKARVVSLKRMMETLALGVN